MPYATTPDLNKKTLIYFRRRLLWKIVPAVLYVCSSGFTPVFSKSIYVGPQISWCEQVDAGVIGEYSWSSARFEGLCAEIFLRPL